MNGPRYVELQATSHFSFLRGASSCEDLFDRAANCGIEALAIVDRNSVAGIVRAHEAAKLTGVRLIVGCRLDLVDGSGVLVYPTDRPAYSRLCRLLSLGKRRAGKARCSLDWLDLPDFAEGLIAVLVPDRADEACAQRLRRLKATFPAGAYLALSLRRRPGDALRLHDLSNLAAQAGVQTVVTNDVLFHHPERRLLQDVVTCVRNGCTIDELGFRRERHADRHLKAAEEMHRLFAKYPEALARTLEIADRCRFSLEELKYQYPDEVSTVGMTPQATLEALTWEGAERRYPEGVPDKVKAILRHELGLIQTLEYAPYFLTVNSIVRFARSQDILCQGRGSAANSAVCYVLGITSIDPERNDLLFERFVSEERREPPDIDVDFEHERREIVMQWVANTDAAAIVVARADRPFASVDDLWRRAGVPAASLVKIAEADGFRPAMDLARREALWAIKALRDEPLPLFAAASAREQQIVPEIDEPKVVLKPMKAGREVVEDYGHVGLTLREHPVTFLRQDLAPEKFITCAAASAGRDMQSCKVAGLVLVRQKPGSAKNVTFITLEDETGVANLVVWEQIYEKHRRIVLTSSMLGVVGRIQREGDVVHVVAYKLIDLSAELASVGGRDDPFPLPHGRGDEFHRGPSAPDPRVPALVQKTRNFH